MKAEGRSAGADHARLGSGEPRVRSPGGRPVVRLPLLRAGHGARGRVSRDRARALGLCDPCAKNFYARVMKTAPGSEPETLEQFKTRPSLRPRPGRPESSRCVWCVGAPGHERAARTNGAVHGLQPASPRAPADGRGVRGRRCAARGSRSRACRSVAALLMTAGAGHTNDRGLLPGLLPAAGCRSPPTSARRRGSGSSRRVLGSRRLTAGGP